MSAARFSAAALVVAASLGAGCRAAAPAAQGSGGAGVPRSGGSNGSTGGTGSAGGGAGSGGMNVDAGAGGSSGAAGGAAPATCEVAPPAQRTAGATLEVPIDLVYQGKPFVYGEPNVITSSKTVVPLEVRFYVSGVELLTSGGASVPVDIVTEAGDLQPYGVFLFNADDPTMQVLRVRAPGGTYAGVKFALGLSVACNAGDPFSRAFPLSADSGMTWPAPVGYLFLRYGALLSSSDSGANTDTGAEPKIPAAIHMGADVRNLAKPGAIVFQVAGPLSIPSTGGRTTRRLHLAMDQVWKGATAEIDVSDNPFAIGEPEMEAGERLRRTAAELPLFVFAD
jgi:hypothetical protein